MRRSDTSNHTTEKTRSEHTKRALARNSQRSSILCCQAHQKVLPGMDKDLEVDINCDDVLRTQQHRRCRKHPRPGAVVDHLLPACRPHM